MKKARTSRPLTAGRAIGAALAAAAVAAVSCEQVLAIDGPVVVQGAGACELAVGVSACESCVASKCCAQASACAGEPACSVRETCMLGCGGDYACRARCEYVEPLVFPSRVPALDTCVAQNCDEACGVSCGINGAFTEPDAAVSCQSCVAANICGQAEACATDLTCESVLWCGLACSTSDCQAACVEQYDGGAFLNYQFALASSCLAPCQFGSLWQCVGHVSLPFAKTNQQTATLTLTDSTTTAPLSGIVAKSCGRSDETCDAPFGMGTSGPDGKVTLALPPASTSTFGFNGYFELTPPSGGLPYLAFTAAPVSEPNAQFAVPMLSLAAFENLASSVAVTLDPSRGHLALAATDCILAPGSGVAFSAQGVGPPPTVLYYGSGLLDPAATATNVSGLAFLFNVPSGIVTVQATPAILGRASSTESLFTRANALSVEGMPPTP